MFAILIYTLSALIERVRQLDAELARSRQRGRSGTLACERSLHWTNYSDLADGFCSDVATFTKRRDFAAWVGDAITKIDRRQTDKQKLGGHVECGE
ncbi:hypothetical protein [Mesorhizobium caraganae]|uniref:hypothetical protein n=1 Tax=Mesorhizobium caraganae TaxID=483206 RepID=UPI00177D236E|nr:hypothetical protein [Mesorhizobium caraganae]